MVAPSPKPEIFLCTAGLPAQKLSAPAEVSKLFIRWQCASPRVDAGVPTTVARALAEALCAHYFATFIAPTALNPPDAPKQWVTYDTYAATTQRRLLRPKMPLIWSRDPAIVAQAFDEYWSTEGQFILLSTQSKPLDFDAFTLQGDPPLILEFVGRAVGASGALLPGVDGDYAGLYLNDEQALRQFIDVDLAQACDHMGVDLRQQSAAEFAPGATSTS
jgi:hypothetical protein